MIHGHFRPLPISGCKSERSTNREAKGRPVARTIPVAILPCNEPLEAESGAEGKAALVAHDPLIVDGAADRGTPRGALRIAFVARPPDTQAKPERDTLQRARRVDAPAGIDCGEIVVAEVHEARRSTDGHLWIDRGFVLRGVQAGSEADRVDA